MMSYERRAFFEIKKIIMREQVFCVYCNWRPVTHIDHVVPRKLGGQTTLKNMVGACDICNRSKGPSSLIEFLIRRFPNSSEVEVCVRLLELGKDIFEDSIPF
jgi:5-methylcytosine-specific restriction endonuclease McrA